MPTGPGLGAGAADEVRVPAGGGHALGREKLPGDVGKVKGGPGEIHAGAPYRICGCSDGSPSAALKQPHHTITHWTTSFR